MTDRIFDTFLRRQYDEGLALAADSDLVRILPIGDPADRFVVALGCKGLVQDSPHHIHEAEHFEVGVWFPADYLRSADPFRVVTWFGPLNTWHPNIAFGAPAICIGHLSSGTGLVDIIYQVFEIVTWAKVTMREDDALNKEACQWARGHLDRFPVDRRPLKRRQLNLHVERVGERCESGA
jgi:hypothetical protein